MKAYSEMTMADISAAIRNLVKQVDEATRENPELKWIADEIDEIDTMLVVRYWDEKSKSWRV